MAAELRIAGRLALHSGGNGLLNGYHGADVLVRAISSFGFEADVRSGVPVGALVRLRLPGAGMMVARVTEARESGLSAHFLNPLAEARLRSLQGRSSPVGDLVAARCLSLSA